MQLVNLAFAAHSGAHSYLKSCTVPRSTNRKLLAWFAVDSTAITIGNVRWGGSTGTRLTRAGRARVVADTRTSAEVWELIDPTPGTLNLYWETGNSSHAHHAAAISAVGVTQNPLSAADVHILETPTTESSSRIVVKVPRGAMVMDLVTMAASANTMSVAGDLAQLWNEAIIGTHVAGSSMAAFPEGGDVTALWTMSNESRLAHVAVILRPAVAGYGNVSDGFVGLTKPMFAIGGGANLGVGTSSEFGGGAGVVALKNVSSNPTSIGLAGGYLYVRSGHLWYRGSSGTLTQVASA